MTTLRALILVAISVAFVGQALADNLSRVKTTPQRQVITDTLKWRSSGSVPGTGPLKVDTMVAATLNDTTLPLDISGATYVGVTILSESKNNDSDFTMFAQVGAQSDTTGPWHTLPTSYSVDNTAGAAVGQSEDMGRDTTFWMLANNTFLDTILSVSSTTGMTRLPLGEQGYVRGARWLRFWFDPDTSAGDTNYLTIIYTLVYD